MIINKTNKDSAIIRPFLILFLSLSFILTGCAGDVSDSMQNDELAIENENPSQKEEQLHKEEFSPELTVNHKIENNSLLITGKTNLPDETILLVTLLNNKSAEIEKNLTVKNGEFSADAIPIEELKSGEQSIKVSLADNQPEAVVGIIGDSRELLVGDYVDANKQLTTSAKIDVPSERAPPSDVQGIKTKVTRVVDGDTFIVHLDGKEERVRLILVDTPETKHPQMGVQPFGPEASAFTTEQLEGKEITLEVGVQERDRYGRILAYAWIGDKLFNQTLLEKGLARVAVYPPNTKYLDDFNAAQNTAKKKAIGIWSIEDYVSDKGFNGQPVTTTSTTKKNTDNHIVAAPKTNHETTNKPKVESKPITETQQVKKVDTQPKQVQKAEPEKTGECNIKGSSSGIYHVPGSTYYERTTNPARWFCSVEEAQNAGFRAPKR
ncbi:thermonuclease family protein [Sporosarcina pasteurii]|uniref:Thermonuclease n=1 Tax=Sporosarcina pasteurii TaxID=1474 RepID=A0A380BCP7_SPOPA|nr:thermonuclease family protein [Sporosarcina pasteurii]MDS9472206.1 thermonuclease family protein [Sporosarcina pasteurii]SUI99201.1 Thermonuclease precursor [Sporosarcina pasteurii]